MQHDYKTLYQQFILFTCTLLLSVISHALSPELLKQLKKENIVDTTLTLSDNQIAKLKSQNKQLYQEKKIDLKILMIPSTNGLSIEQYANEVFNTLKIGNQKLDNGLLLVVAKNDHKMRFEVGYGLEGDFPDIQAGRMIRNTLAPNFKNNDYYQGFYQVQQSLLKLDILFSNTLDKQKNILTTFNFYVQLFLSILLCIPLYWLYTRATVNWGTSAGFGIFTACLVFEIFIHIFIFSYLQTPKIAFFICSLIPLYAPLLVLIFLPKNQNHKLLKSILYSLPLQIFSILGLGIFYYVDFFPKAALVLLQGLAIIFILIFLRYLQFLYRFHHHTENAYLTSFYNQYLKEKERQQAIDEEFKRTNVANHSNDSSSSSSSSSSNSSSNSSSSSSSSNDRDSGGSSGGGGASGSW
ncbi:hypothetical protein BEN71_15325 [Acinetobacter wuhouensis]|uniref:TPM domain-containing protein n=1 Tax=Acinetobacter wuhouensis TaxID=1879050 RepID=UPI00083B4DC0|nr:TPM domain-containing protein [Acinetobacter wuhouensis]AXQ23358.1 hypothetical protein BEN71_15325 [Acinetobacter wuhouensis]